MNVYYDCVEDEFFNILVFTEEVHYSHELEDILSHIFLFDLPVLIDLPPYYFLLHWFILLNFGHIG